MDLHIKLRESCNSGQLSCNTHCPPGCNIVCLHFPWRESLLGRYIKLSGMQLLQTKQPKLTGVYFQLPDNSVNSVCEVKLRFRQQEGVSLEIHYFHITSENRFHYVHILSASLRFCANCGDNLGHLYSSFPQTAVFEAFQFVTSKSLFFSPQARRILFIGMKACQWHIRLTNADKERPADLVLGIVIQWAQRNKQLWMADTSPLECFPFMIHSLCSCCDFKSLQNSAWWIFEMNSVDSKSFKRWK